MNYLDLDNNWLGATASHGIARIFNHAFWFCFYRVRWLRLPSVNGAPLTSTLDTQRRMQMKYDRIELKFYPGGI